MTDPWWVFTELFDTAPDGTWQAPGRVNLIGEHIDYNGGKVLPFAIQFTTRAHVRLRNDRLIRMSSLQSAAEHRSGVVDANIGELSPGPPEGWASYPLGVAWSLREHGLDRGFDLLIDGDVPAGAGLSSSAALECAVALALDDLAGLGLDRLTLARAAQQGENSLAGVACGIMDQAASLLATADHALLLDTATLQTRQVPCRPDRDGLALMVVDSGTRHRLGTSPYQERQSECLLAAQQLGVEHLCDLAQAELDQAMGMLATDTLRRRARHVITENERVEQVAHLLDAGRLAEVGEILNHSHRSLADDFDVSSAEQDAVVTSAIAAGALGARMVGGGFGGSAIVLAERDACREIDIAVASTIAGLHGHATRTFVSSPSNGAMRVR